jgi:RluA family pseudouridine synthase
VAKTTHIELGDGTLVPILFENRSLLVLDKPAGWVLTPDVPVPGRSNLQLAIESSIRGGAFWARQRGLKFLRFIHRLDADTSGALMFGKHLGAMRPLSVQFARRQVEKLYLAVTHGVPKQDRWICQLPLGPHPEFHGMHRVDPENGKQAETHFQVLQKTERSALVLVRPITGRTHQIRLHLLANRTPVAGDRMYAGADRDMLLGLRSIRLEFTDPFTRKPIKVSAPTKDFIRHYKFDAVQAAEQIKAVKFDAPLGFSPEDDDESDEDEPLSQPVRATPRPQSPGRRVFADPRGEQRPRARREEVKRPAARPRPERSTAWRPESEDIARPLRRPARPELRSPAARRSAGPDQRNGRGR